MGTCFHLGNTSSLRTSRLHQQGIERFVQACRSVSAQVVQVLVEMAVVLVLVEMAAPVAHRHRM
jgi:hypothetical protein